jgi:hypothetical protein
LTRVGPALYLLTNVLRPRGAINLIGVFLLLGLAVVGYAGWLFIPIFFDNLDMREATTSTFNRMASDSDNDRLRTYLLSRSNSIGTHWETEGGTSVEKKGLGLTDADIVIERDAFEHTAHLQVDYQRAVKLWPTERFKTFEFHVEKAGKLPQ